MAMGFESYLTLLTLFLNILMVSCTSEVSLFTFDISDTAEIYSGVRCEMGFQTSSPPFFCLFSPEDIFSIDF